MVIHLTAESKRFYMPVGILENSEFQASDKMYFSSALFILQFKEYTAMNSLMCNKIYKYVNLI